MTKLGQMHNTVGRLPNEGKRLAVQRAKPFVCGFAGLGHSAGGPAPRIRSTSAVLLWRANQPVPINEPTDLLRDGAPPGRARETVHALVMRLRRQLDSRAAARIVLRVPGYAIEVARDELDVGR